MTTPGGKWTEVSDDVWVIGDEPLPARCDACEQLGSYPICCADHEARMCPWCARHNHGDAT